MKSLPSLDMIIERTNIAVSSNLTISLSFIDCRILWVVLFLCSISSIGAQEIIVPNRLIKEFFQSSKPKIKTNIGLQIADIYIEGKGSRDSISKYLRLSLLAAYELNNAQKALIFFEIGKDYSQIQSYSIADSLFKSALELTESNHTRSEIKLFRHSMLRSFAHIHECTNSLDSVLLYLNRIDNNHLLSNYYREKGYCYLENSQLLEGLKNLLKAEEIASEEDPDLPYLLTIIGTVYDELEIFEKTLEYGLKAQKLARNNNDKEREIDCIQLILSGAFALQEIDTIKKTSQRVFHLIESHKIDLQRIGYVYFILGKTALLEKRPKLAKDYFHTYLKIAQDNEDAEEISAAHEGLSEVYFEENDVNKAQQYATLALEYDPPYISDRTLGISKIYARNKKYKLAYELLEKDAIKKKRQHSLNNPSAIISTLLTEKFTQEETNFANDLKIQKDLGIRNLIIGLFLVITGFLTFFYLYNRKKNKLQTVELKRIVTEQTKEILQQKENLEILDQAKTRLYTNITHEFRTPLTVISGIAAQLTGNSESKSIIKRNSEQLLNLINQMLDLRKLESGSISINKTQGDIVRFMRYLTDSLKSYAEVQGLNIHFLSDDKKLVMDFDKEKITRIHSNLLSNAIKFTPEGGNIYIQLQSAIEEEPRHLSIKIKDTGMGISKAELPYIFNRFYQVDDSTTRQGEGTGIGLTLVSELVKAMDGEINVTSTIGEGSTFSIMLPITNKAIQAEDFSSEMVSSTVMADMSKPTNKNLDDLVLSATKDQIYPSVLIVEDNVDVVHYLINCLKDYYTIEIAMNGKEGIDKAISQIPDIIVSDVMMPIKDGFELCQTLKNDERTSHIPIILLTAKADIESRLEGLQRGADAYLNKPFHQEELSSILKNLLALRKSLQGQLSLLSDQSSSEGSNSFLMKEEVTIHLKIEDAFLQKIRDIIETDLSDNKVGMSQLIRGLGMSRSQIFKKVKALTGGSPSIYIRSIRLQHAQRLLKTEDLNVSEVAYAVGFSSPVYFSDVFLEQFGIRPIEMRK